MFLSLCCVCVRSCATLIPAVINRQATRFSLRSPAGGEDSFFISTTDRIYGVADGVSGWASVGVDPADFSRQLMRCARAVCERGAGAVNAVLDPSAVLEEAYEQSKHIVGALHPALASVHMSLQLSAMCTRVRSSQSQMCGRATRVGISPAWGPHSGLFSSVRGGLSP